MKKSLLILVFVFCFLFSVSYGVQAYVNSHPSPWQLEQYDISPIEELRTKYERETWESIQSSYLQNDELKQHLLSMQKLSTGTNTYHDIQEILGQMNQEEYWTVEPNQRLSSVTSSWKPQIDQEQPEFLMGWGNFNPFVELSVLSMISMGFVGALMIPQINRKLRGKSKLFVVGLICVWVFFFGYYTGYVLAQSSEVTIEKGSFYVEANYIIFMDGTTIKARNGQTGALDYSGSDASTVINNALSALTAGRSWKEKVLIKGDFTVSTKIQVPSYTILEIQGKLKLADSADQNLIENSDLSGGNTYIDIIGGELDGNKANQTNGGVELEDYRNCIHYNNVTKSRIIRVNIHDGMYAGIHIVGNSHENLIQSNYVHDNGNLTNRMNPGILIFSGGLRNQVIGNFFINNGQTGIYISQNAHYTEVIGNLCKDNDRRGMLLSQSNKLIIDGNICVANGISASGDAGIKVDTGDALTISNNVLAENHWFGLYAIDVDNSVISGNQILLNKREGIYFYRSSYNKVQNNMIKDNGQAVHNNYVGLALYDDTVTFSTYNIIQGNTFLETQAKKCARGIHELNSGDDYNVIKNNFFKGQASGPVDLAGANDTVKYNVGYVTENAGTATVANDDWFAHGLASTPSIVVLTPINGTYSGVPVVMGAIDKNSTHVQCSVYWTNGTVITTGLQTYYYAEV